MLKVAFGDKPKFNRLVNSVALKTRTNIHKYNSLANKYNTAKPYPRPDAIPTGKTMSRISKAEKVLARVTNSPSKGLARKKALATGYQRLKGAQNAGKIHRRDVVSNLLLKREGNKDKLKMLRKAKNILLRR